MALNGDISRTRDAGATAEPGSIRPERRVIGPDVVRAVALIGVVVMNYHGYLIIRGASRGDSALEQFFDPWDGPLATRFAATFVLVAGIGATLISRSSEGDRRAMRDVRWRLVRRGLLLYVVGIAFDMIWNGTILPYYGAMFALAGLLVAWRSRWVLLVGLIAALAGATIHWWRTERAIDGASTEWIEEGSRSPRAVVLDVFVNGTHPLLPWLAFFCTGIVLGRLLQTSWWRVASIAAGFLLFTWATLISALAMNDAPAGSVRATLASTDPFERGLLYSASALGTALVAFGTLAWVAERWSHVPLVQTLKIAGQMTLTLYIAHGLFFNLLVDWWEWVDPAGLGTALAFAAVFWIAGIAFAWAWSQRYRRGPLEIVYRRLTT